MLTKNYTLLAEWEFEDIDSALLIQDQDVECSGMVDFVRVKNFVGRHYTICFFKGFRDRGFGNFPLDTIYVGKNLL